MKFVRWLGVSVSTIALALGGGGAAHEAAKATGMSDTALDRAFQRAFGISAATAQEISFTPYLEAALAGLPASATADDLEAAIRDAIVAFVAAGGTVLPSVADLVAAFPELAGLADAYVAAVSDAVADGVIPPEVAVLALGGTVS